MEIEISAQAAAFLCAGLLGALLGLLYDLLRALRTLWKGRGTALTDGLYSLAVLISVFYFAMAFGQGQLRIYMVLGILAGAVLFFSLLSQPLRPLWDYWRDSLLLTLHILLSPAVFLWRLLKKLLLPFKKCFLFYLIRKLAF